jgi:hypothetical protein
MNRTDKIIGWLKNNKILSIIIVIGILIAAFAATLKNLKDIRDILGFGKSYTAKKNRLIAPKDTSYAVLSSDEAEQTVYTLLRQKPAYYGYKNIFGQNYLVTYTDYNHRFTLFKELKGIWENVQTIDTIKLDMLARSYKEWEFTALDSVPILFYTDYSYGSTFGSVCYNLIAFNSDYSYRYYSIFIGGAYGGDGMIDNSKADIIRNDLAKQKNKFTKFIEDKMVKLKAVSVIGKADIDYDRPENAIEWWDKENGALVSSLQDFKDTTAPRVASENLVLKFKYYKEDLRKYFLDGASIDTEENQHYILYRIFKFGCLLYDKTTGGYFIAFMHENMNVTTKLKDDKLKVEDAFRIGESFTIDLHTGKITFLPPEKY